jgi:hypothetical protein
MTRHVFFATNHGCFNRLNIRPPLFATEILFYFVTIVVSLTFEFGGGAGLVAFA